MTATVWVLIGWFYGASIGMSTGHGLITVSHIASEADCIALGQAIAGQDQRNLRWRCVPYTGRI